MACVTFIVPSLGETDQRGWSRVFDLDTTHDISEVTTPCLRGHQQRRSARSTARAIGRFEQEMWWSHGDRIRTGFRRWPGCESALSGAG